MYAAFIQVLSYKTNPELNKKDTAPATMDLNRTLTTIASSKSPDFSEEVLTTLILYPFPPSS